MESRRSSWSPIRHTESTTIRNGGTRPDSVEQHLGQDYEALGATAEEWEEQPEETLSEEDRAATAAEITDLDEFARLATGIEHNAKGDALLAALRIALAKAAALGAEQKAIIFTESRRTQDYLLRVLADSPWSNGRLSPFWN